MPWRVIDARHSPKIQQRDDLFLVRAEWSFSFRVGGMARGMNYGSGAKLINVAECCSNSGSRNVTG